MKVTIFEKEHFEGAFPVIKLFDRPGNDITIITSDYTHRRFLDLFGSDAERFTWKILATKGKLQFFYSLYKILKKQRPDILYINTISDNHILYAFVLRLLALKRVVLTVHDINCLFESSSSRNPKKWTIHRGKKWLTKLVHEFNVVADTMTPYLRTKTGQKRTHVVPGAVYENRYLPQPIESSLRIVVPGSLDKRRRDYEQVFELANYARNTKTLLQIILLGGGTNDYAEDIRGRAAAFSTNYSKMISYDNAIVDQDEFDRQMDGAHFVFIPSVIQTKICGDIPEIYGVTKSSGNIFDVIKHAKPFIVPAGLVVSENLRSSCFQYNRLSEVIEFLMKISSSPSEYDHWQNRAIENSGHYTIDEVRKRNASLFD